MNIKELTTAELETLINQVACELASRDEVLNVEVTMLTKAEVVQAADRELDEDELDEVSTQYFSHLQTAMTLQEALSEAGLE